MSEAARRPRKSPRASSPSSTGAGPLPFVAAGLASLALLAVVWCVDYLPTHDGPQHIFGSYLNNHLDDAAKNYAAYFRPGGAVTGLGFSIFFSSLEVLLPWRIALGVTLSVVLLGWAWGFFFLCRTLEPRRWPIGLLGFVCAPQWALYMGMFSYVASSALVFHVLAVALRRWPWTWKERLFVGALLTIQAVFHVFGAQVSGLLLGAVVLARATPEERWRELGWLLALSIPTLLVGWLAADIGATRVNPAHVATAVDLLSLSDHFQLPAALFFGGPWWRRWPLVLASLLASAIAAAQARREDVPRERTALLAASALLLVVAIAAPVHLSRWDYFSPRFLPFALMLPLALVPLERLAGLDATSRRALAAAGVVFLGANFAWLVAYNRDVRVRAGDALAGAAAPLHRTGARLPIVLDPNVGLAATSLSAAMPYAFPIRNVGALYALEQGGVVPYLFASEPRVHEHVIRRDKNLGLPLVPDRAYISPIYEEATPDPAERRVILEYMASFGSRYEDVILSGTRDDGDELLARGFAEDWRRGGVVVARFEGCPTRLRVRSPEVIQHPVQIAYGWYPSMEAHWAQLFAKPSPPSSELAMDLPEAPCGDVWVRVVYDRDESGAVSGGDYACERAAPDGVVLMRLQKGPSTVDCELAPMPAR